MQLHDFRWPFISVDLELTNICPLSCKICPRTALTRSAGYMDPWIFRTVADRLALVPSRIALSGLGSPLSHPEWPEFISYYKNLGGRIGIVENALNLTENSLDLLLQVRPSFVELSIPSVNANVHESLTGKPLQPALEMAEKLALKGRKLFKITCVGVKTAMNPEEKVRYIAYWNNQGIDARVLECHSRGGEVPFALRTAKAIHSEKCGLFAFHSFVTWQGELLSCCHDVTGETSIGSMIDNSLEELAVKKQLILDSGMPFRICRSCDETLKKLPLPDRRFPGSSRAISRFFSKIFRGDFTG